MNNASIGFEDTKERIDYIKAYHKAKGFSQEVREVFKSSKLGSI